VLTVAHLCLLFACGGGETVSPDARRSCAETADPHDEDGDGFVDACDNCPAIENNQADTTEIAMRAFADGVGDACDPRPGVSGDDLHAFHSFASDAQASAWTGSGFSIEGDALHVAGQASLTSARPAPGDGGLYVLAQISSITFGGTGALSITLDGDGIGAGATCTLDALGVTATEVGGASSSESFVTAIEPMQPITFVAWRTVVLTPTGRAAEVRCRATRGGVTKEARVMLTDDLVSGTYLISVSDASSAIASLSVYTSPGPKNP
jgi:hypothetical protein